MKVLQVTAGISPRYGGSRALLGMSRALREQGVETQIATTDADLVGRLKVPLGRLVEMDGSLVYHFHTPVLSKYGFSRQLSQWLRDNLKDYDLVHFHGIFSHGLISGVAAAGRSQVPYIIRPMGQLSPWCMSQRGIRKKVFFSALGMRYLNRAAAIHYTAQEEKEDSERLGIKAPGAVIPLGVDESDLNPHPSGGFRPKYPSTEGKKIIVYMSRIDPRKGLELLIEAIKSLSCQRDDFVLVMAGTGNKDYEEKIRALVRSSGLSERIILTGFISQEVKWALFQDADIFVLTTHYENFGMAIAEAMAAGLPVVISRHVNTHQDIKDFGAGIVTSSNSAEISSALKRLLDDDALRHKMGENARNLVEEKFRWKTIAPKLIQLYESIIQRSGGKSNGQPRAT